MAGGFIQNSRLLSTKLPTLTKPTGGGSVSVQLPKVGMLAGILLDIQGEVTGSLSNENALGLASVLSRVRVITNSAIDLVDVSGAGYAYLLNELLESEYHLAQGQNTGRDAVTATTFNLSMWLPIAMNLRDPVGVVMLQNEQTLVQLQVEFAADSDVATGATVTATVDPLMLYYTVPTDPADYPPLNVLHTMIETREAVSAAGDYTYIAPRGYTYLQVAHGLGIGASGSDDFSRLRVRVNQSQFLHDWDTDDMDMLHYLLRGRARPAGGAFVDYLGATGLGNYGTSRDLINSAQVTDLAHVITATGSGTLYTIRRQLVPLA